MKPEALFASAISALFTADMGSARILINQASIMAARVADTYYSDNPVLFSTFHGLAYFYKAFFDFSQAQRDLTKLELDKLESEDILKNAIEAERLLAQADPQNLQIQNCHNIAKALVDILSVTQRISVRMHDCFKSTFKPDQQSFKELLSMTRRAVDHVSKAGPHAVPLLRFCEELLGKIQNVERLASPRKADFGIYSGLVSAVLFSILLVVALWTRSVFGFELDNRIFFLVIVGLSLIGGFGFGALKFKNFLFSHTQRVE